MAIISRPSIPEVIFERVKSDLTEFAFNFFQDGISLDVSARTYKIRLKASGVNALDKGSATNADGRVIFSLTDVEKLDLKEAEYQFFLVEILTGGGEKTLTAGTLRWSVPFGKPTGLVSAPDVSVNYITATQELMVALGVVDFGSSSSAISAAQAQAAAETAQSVLAGIAEIQIDVAEKNDLVNEKTTTILNAAEAVSNDRQSVADMLTNAVLAENPLGEYDAAANMPARSAIPPAVPVKSFHEITVAGPAAFGGSNFAIGQSLAVGGRLIKKDETQWFYAPPSDLALTKSIQLEKDTLIARVPVESYSPTSANGGVAVGTPATITIPNGQTGYQSALALNQTISAHPEYVVGKTIRIRASFTKNDASLPTSKFFFDLNVNRGAGFVSNQATNKSTVVDGMSVLISYDYIIQGTDVTLQPVFIVSGSGVTNASGTNWIISLVGMTVEVVNNAPKISRIGDEFAILDQTTKNQATSIDNKKINGFMLPTSYSGQALNGATGNAAARISIPAGQTGNSSYVRPHILTSNIPSWADAVGIPITISYKVQMSADFYPTKSLASTLTVTRSGSDITATITSASIIKVSSTVLRVQFTYTPNAADSVLKPVLQTSGAGGAVVADAFFEIQEITYSHAIPDGFRTENDYFVAKMMSLAMSRQNAVDGRTAVLEGQMTTANNNIATNTTAISDKTLGGSVFPARFNGQALNGATGGSSKRVTIPNGQTGNSSYVRAVIPVTDIPTWADVIGVPVTFSYKVLMSADFYPTKSLTQTLTVNRTGGEVTGSITNASISKLSATVLLVTFTYTPQATDIELKPFIQTSGVGAAVSADSFFEMQEITYSHAVPAGFTSVSNYFASKQIALAAGKTAAIDVRVSANETTLSQVANVFAVTLTVKPDGTGNYISPKLANDAITDSSATKKYEIVVYPGIYTEVEWKLKPYVFLRGIDRDSCWLKGELPDSTDDTHRTTSTLWLEKTSGLSNLKVTAKNMRYAVHSEQSGGNANEVHTMINCHFEHYGNQGLIDWRTANPGSGLTLPQVWSSARPWGYGSASGLIERYYNCTFVSPIEAYYVHNNLNFGKANANELQNCSFARTGSFGRVARIESQGSGQNDLISILNGNSTPGFISHADSPWITAAAANQYANHADFSIFVSGTSVLGYQDSTRGKALRIKSKSTATGSKIRLSGTAVSALLGNVFEVDGCAGLAGYAYGYWDISGILVGINSDTAVNNTLGKRLGDCTIVNKVLTVTADGGAGIDVTFNANYTAVDNAAILTFINGVINSVAVADEYNPALNEYYPVMSPYEATIKNTGTVGIPRFHAVGYSTDKSNIRLLTTVDPASKFVGVALENIAIGKAGRVLMSGILEKNIQIPGVTGAVSMDTDISISSTVNGQFELSSTKPVMKGIATDWAQFKSTT